ncbi:transmembrane 9 superfamily member 1-like protein [Lates japonicus]|uniref:Transmembrane 9 superfamily member n=1 Tax=Lates japonicus TaxID=270547 RepID=A0AAD3R473_LATJO|nr:transmembrane 9 superfamily member 1-like protein [Lates japonicus]
MSHSIDAYRSREETVGAWTQRNPADRQVLSDLRHRTEVTQHRHWLDSGLANSIRTYVNKVGPYHNPQETYHYYTPPVCSPEKNDFARYNVEEEGGCDDLDQGDNGWKIIHTDVFRFPPYKSLLCAVLGVGAQFLTLATGIIIMALLGMFNVHRHGAINSAAIVLYALTSCVSGYVSCSFYTQINGQRWVWNIILTSSLFSDPHELLAWKHTRAVHMAIAASCHSVPSLRSCTTSCQILPAEEHHPHGLPALANLLSVGARIRGPHLLPQSGETTVVVWVPRWSTGPRPLFISAHSAFYYRTGSVHERLVQSTEFFGYSLLTALVFSLMLGSVAFWASLAFIRYIYRSLKMD